MKCSFELHWFILICEFVWFYTVDRFKDSFVDIYHESANYTFGLAHSKLYFCKAICLFSQNTTMLFHLHIACALTSFSAELSSCSKDHMLSKYENYYIILCSGVPSNRIESMFIKCCKFSYIDGNC